MTRRSRLTPEQRRNQAKLAALTRWSRLTPDERVAATVPARRARQAQFDAAPNPEAARKAHAVRMAIASHRARST